MANRVTIEIAADGTAFVVGSKKVDAAIARTGKRGKSAFKSIGIGVKATIRAMMSLQGLLLQLGAAIALKKLVTSVFNARSITEKYEVTLNRLLGSQREGNRLFEKLAEYASRVPFEYEKIMSAGVQLSGIMKGGVDQITEWLPMIGDLAAVSRLGIEETTGQVIRMYSAGAGAADLFRERGILAMMGFKAGVTYTVEETRKKMMQAWTKMGSQFRGATGDLAETWDGLMSMFSDKWFSIRNKIADAGLFEYVKGGLNLILEHIQKLEKEGRLDIWAEEVSRGAVNALLWIVGAIGTVIEVMRFFHNGWLGIKLVSNATVAAMTDNLRTVFQGLRILLKPLDLIFQGLVALGKIKINPFDKAEEVIGNFQLSTRDVFNDTVKEIESTNAAYDKTKGIVDGIAKKMKEIEVSQSNVAKGASAPPLPPDLSVLDEEQKKAQAKAKFESYQRLAALEAESPYKPDGGGSQMEAIRDEYNQKLVALQTHNANVLKEMGIQGASEAEIVKKYEELKRAADAKTNEYKITGTAHALGVVSNIMQNLYVATGSRHKALFKMMQGFAIAEAIINTRQGATKALAQGGIYGFIAAASVIAAGMAQVRQIASTKPGGGASISAGGSAAPKYDGGSPTAYPVPQRSEAKQIVYKTEIVVMGNLTDMSDLAREFGTFVKEAKEDGVDFGD